MARLPRLFFIMVFMCFISAHASSENKVIRVAVNHYPPWIVAQDGIFSGIDVEVLHFLANKLNVELHFTDCLIKRCLDLVKHGQADLIPGVYKDPDREAFLHFVEPHYFTDPPKVFYTKKGSDVIIKQYEDLYQYQIGVRTGAHYFAQFDSDSKIQKMEAMSEIALLRMLLSERFDAFISTESQADYLAAQYGLFDRFDKSTYRPGKVRRTYIGVSMKTQHADLVNRLSQEVALGVKSGVFQNIATEYYRKLNRESSMKLPSDSRSM